MTEGGVWRHIVFILYKPEPELCLGSYYSPVFCHFDLFIPPFLVYCYR